LHVLLAIATTNSEFAIGEKLPVENSTPLNVCVTALENTMVLRNSRGRFPVVSKELCYGKAETLGDAAKWWQDNLF
jgi:hypothetical protein